MNWKRICTLVLFFCWLIIRSAWLPAFSQEPFFGVLPVGSEINNATLQTFYQDRQGFFWLGTSNGLFRFDGTRYIQVSAADSLKDASYTAIFEDVSGTIWTGTSTGTIVTIRLGKPELFNPEEGNPAAGITGIAQDSNGNIWFSTYGEGAYCWSRNRLFNVDSEDGLGDNFTYTIVGDHSGRVWIGTDGGISVCSLVNEKKQVVTLNAQSGLPDNIVLSLALSGKEAIWAGMLDGGICKIDIRSHKIEIPPAVKDVPAGPVNDLLISGHHLWAASGVMGIMSVDLQSSGGWVNRSRFGGNDYVKFHKVLQDIHSNLWFLADKAVVRTPGDKVEFLSPEQNAAFSQIKSVLADRKGNVWFSNDRGLFRYRPGSVGNVPEQFISGQTHPGIHIISLFEDQDGFIWAGTFDKGLFHLDPATGEIITYTEKDGLSNNNVLSITGVDNEIWFATLGGASRCQMPGSGKKATSKPLFEKFGVGSGLGNNFIYSVFADSKKRLWFATDGKGITVYENGRFRNFLGEDGVNSKIVYSIAQEQNGHIWFTTSNEGLFHYDGKSFRTFSLKDGLSDLDITGLAAASSPVIFIVHPGGIDVLEPITEKFSFIGKEHGIGQINSNLNAVSADRNNDLVWIGTDKGLVKLSADAFLHPYSPLMRLTSVKVFLSETDTLKSHSFPHNQNHFTFDFIGLWYLSPDQVQYQVMLEGYDLDWIPTRNSSVIYSSLSPGEYTFRVKASLTGNFLDAPAVSYHFVIRKPFWLTYWFIGLSIIFTAGFIYLFMRTRERRLIREETLQKEKLLFQLQTLKNQVNPHFLFNSFSTLSAVIDEDKEMALDYVQKLSAFFRNILESHDKPVVTLQEELLLADNYYYLQKKRYGANLKFVTEIPGKLLQTFIPPMTLQMLIENAVKHNVVSSDKPLTVRITASPEQIVITNIIQVKRNVTDSTGMGLQNIKNRYRLLVNKEIGIENTGNSFTVTLPVINSIPK